MASAPPPAVSPSRRPQHHHILLLGATGLCGQLFAHYALAAGHSLTLFVRSPDKLAAALRHHPAVTVLTGELGSGKRSGDEAGRGADAGQDAGRVEGKGTYDDDNPALVQAAACGADTLVSFAGPTMGSRQGTPITDGYRQLFALLAQHATVSRALVLSTPSYSAPEDRRSLKWLLAIRVAVRAIARDAYPEVRGMAEQTVALGDSIAWTVFRVPLLRGGEQPDPDLAERLPQVAGENSQVNNKTADTRIPRAVASFVGDSTGRDGLVLDRGALARWVLEEMDARRWVGKCPMVSNA